MLMIRQESNDRIPEQANVFDTMEDLTLEKVGPENLSECGIGCLTNRQHPGYQSKVDWLQRSFADGLRFLLARDGDGQPLGFLEYVLGEFAWRPVEAAGWLFVHCLPRLARSFGRTTCGRRNSLTAKNGPQTGLFGGKTGGPRPKNNIFSCVFSVFRDFWPCKLFLPRNLRESDPS
jgi:hypothetical protein